MNLSDIKSREIMQPRSQDLYPGLGVGREKGLFPRHPQTRLKVLGTRLGDNENKSTGIWILHAPEIA